MDIGNLPILAARGFGNAADPGPPVLSFAWNAEGSHRLPGHSYPCGQIICQNRGVCRVATPLGNSVVPRHQVIWIPPGLQHETVTSAPASALLRFVDAAHAGPCRCTAGSWLPAACCACSPCRWPQPGATDYRQAGMTLLERRKQLRLPEAVDLPGQGEPVTSVARELRNCSPGVFMAMFLRNPGVCPGQ